MAEDRQRQFGNGLDVSPVEEPNNYFERHIEHVIANQALTR